jgi:hypothetical protein
VFRQWDSGKTLCAGEISPGVTEVLLSLGAGVSRYPAEWGVTEPLLPIWMSLYRGRMLRVTILSYLLLYFFNSFPTTGFSSMINLYICYLLTILASLFLCDAFRPHTLIIWLGTWVVIFKLKHEIYSFTRYKTNIHWIDIKNNKKRQRGGQIFD